MLQRVSYCSLPEDVSRDCARSEKALIHALTAPAPHGEAGPLRLWSYDGTRRETRPGALTVKTSHGTALVKLKPDYAAIQAHRGRVYGVVVEAACTSIDRALPRVLPRLLLYKAWLEACHGPHTVAIYAPLVPTEGPWAAAVTVTDPVKAASRIASMLSTLPGLLEQPKPPSPGRKGTPCSHCGYRGICPYARTQPPGEEG